MADTFDIDSFINEEYNNNNTNNLNKNLNKDLNNINDLSSYELLIFTDGAHERVKKRSSFGIYILCKNKQSNLYKFNEMKIIKKITKHLLLFNSKTNTIYYHSLFNNNNNEKCKFDGCNYYAIYSNDELDIGSYCKIHKSDNMTQSMIFYNYEPTNIRAEGLAILYSLIYIRFITIDLIIEKNMLIKDLNNIIMDPNMKFNEYHTNIKNTNYKKFLIITDSEFWINVITKWMNNWIKQDVIKDKKNLDIIYYINNLLYILFQNKIIIDFKFVRGHADKVKSDNEVIKYSLFQKGNIIADKLANIAKENTNNDIKISI